MGWTGVYKYPGTAAKQYLKNYFTESNPVRTWEVLRIEMVGKVAYLACKVTELSTNNSYVSALVVVTDTPRKRGASENFYFKDISEFCGPSYHDCPDSILKLLTPLDKMPSRIGKESIDWADSWRKKCQAQNKLKSEAEALISEGAKFEFVPAVPLSGGQELKVAEVRAMKPFYAIGIQPLLEIKGLNKKWLTDMIAADRARLAPVDG